MSGFDTGGEGFAIGCARGIWDRVCRRVDGMKSAVF